MKHTDNLPDGSQARSFHESISFNVGDETIRERTVRPVVNHDDSSHEQKKCWTMWTRTPEFQDYHIPLWSMRKVPAFEILIQKIENHPDRHALQQDLRQSQSFNAFSPETNQMIHDVGNIELSELLKTESKTQCTVCLSYGKDGILYCTCGHFFHKEVPIRNSSIFRWTFFQSLSMSSRREDLMDIDVVESRETEYYTANQLKKCKKRFPRNPWPIHTRSRIP